MLENIYEEDSEGDAQRLVACKPLGNLESELAVLGCCFHPEFSAVIVA